jgi:predicted  nucleic acid-binding Zn-ribbon protein
MSEQVDVERLLDCYEGCPFPVTTAPVELLRAAAAEITALRERVEELEQEKAEAEQALVETWEILAGGDSGSLPNDWAVPRIAAARMDDIDKLTWQVRDTCARAEAAEAKAEDERKSKEALERVRQINADELAAMQARLSRLIAAADAMRARWGKYDMANDLDWDCMEAYDAIRREMGP